MPKKQLDEIQLGEIKALIELNWTNVDIANKFLRSEGCIRKIRKKISLFGTPQQRPGRGPKRKTSPAMDRRIVRAIEIDGDQSIRQLQVDNDLMGVSTTTVRRRVLESGKYGSYYTVKKPFVNEQQRLRRLQWAREMVNRPIEFWRSIFWTDESPYELRCKAKRRIWRKHDEKYKPKNCMATVKHDKKINVWGGFAYHGVGEIHRIEGIMNGDVYRRLLDNVALPSMRDLFGRNVCYYQQDNDPKHTARETTRFFEDQGITLLPWPSQSPDLNPIENLWSILDQRIRKRRCRNEAELYTIIQEGWRDLPVELLHDLVDSMPRRCAKVIENDGYPTKY